MLLLSVMTACEEDAALLNPDVGHDKSTVPEETVTSLGDFNSTTSPGNAIIQLIAGSSEQENRGLTDAGVEDEVCFVLSKPAEKDLTLKSQWMNVIWNRTKADMYRRMPCSM